jgi:hypothetical protein
MRVQLRFVEVFYLRLQPDLLLGFVEHMHELRHEMVERRVSDETHAFDLVHFKRFLHVLHSKWLYEIQLAVLHFLQSTVDLFFL